MPHKSSNEKGGPSRPLNPHGVSETKQPEHGIQSSTEAQRCPYHRSILHLEPPTVSRYELSPMGRFLAESPSEQSSLFLRPDTGKLSTSKECLCDTENTTERQMSGGNGKSESVYRTKEA